MNAESKFESSSFFDTPGSENATFRRKLSSVSFNIITSEEIDSVRRKFTEDIEALLEEAINRHRSSSTGDVPWWLWLILIWLGHDNVLSWLSSPFFFWPMLILAAIASILYSMGILGLVINLSMPVIKGTVNAVLAKTPVNIRI